jgi:uncharacterized membrane-anchored protein YjiN (DUF445 family)
MGKFFEPYFKNVYAPQRDNKQEFIKRLTSSLGLVGRLKKLQKEVFPMLQVAQLEKFQKALQRIFMLKVQNAAVAATEGNKEAAQHLFQTVVKGTSEQGDLDDITYQALQETVKNYSVPISLSRDVSEKGEFINLVTSDTLRQGESFAFLNRIRRVDGEDFQFISDLDGSLHLMMHFGSRLQELKTAEGGKELLASKTKALSVVRDQINALLDTQ